MKRVLSLFLSAALLLSLSVSIAGLTAFAQAHLSDAPEGFVAIHTKEELDAVRNAPHKNYILMNDLVFDDADFQEGGSFYHEGDRWIPIPEFFGEFDGNGYAICNLQVRAENRHAGLFGLIKGAEIKNLGMEGGEFSLTSSARFKGVGSIAGEARDSTVIACYNTGHIAAASSDSAIAGGLVGHAYTEYGSSGSVVISRCYNTGTVENNSVDFSSAYAAGILGWSTGSYEVIEDCYNTGRITATATRHAYASGIECAADGSVRNCYNIGAVDSVNAMYSSPYPITWELGGAVENCYYLLGSASGGSGYECTYEHMTRQATYGGFDFDSVWEMKDGEYPYPQLRGVPMEFTKAPVGIAMVAEPSQTEYYLGLEELDVSGGVIALYYNDGQRVEVEVTPEMVSGFDKTVSGTQVITVTYRGFFTTFSVLTKPLLWDDRITTDETLTLSYEANREFRFIVSDGKLGQITSVSKTSVSIGSYVRVAKEATFVPSRPGYVLVRAVDESGVVLAENLVLIEEGEHRMVFSETLRAPSFTESGLDLYVCEFCGHAEEREVAKKCIFGDANGDGDVNMKDVVLLRRYLANFDFSGGTSSVEVAEGADANGDGGINMKDVVLLRQYLANFDFATGSSSVVLGPQK